MMLFCVFSLSPLNEAITGIIIAVVLFGRQQSIPNLLPERLGENLTGLVHVSTAHEIIPNFNNHVRKFIWEFQALTKNAMQRTQTVNQASYLANH
jgi:hypothetical protein